MAMVRIRPPTRMLRLLRSVAYRHLDDQMTLRGSRWARVLDVILHRDHRRRPVAPTSPPPRRYRRRADEMRDSGTTSSRILPHGLQRDLKASAEAFPEYSGLSPRDLIISVGNFALVLHRQLVVRHLNLVFTSRSHRRTSSSPWNCGLMNPRQTGPYPAR